MTLPHLKVLSLMSAYSFWDPTYSVKNTTTGVFSQAVKFDFAEPGNVQVPACRQKPALIKINAGVRNTHLR